MHLQYRNNASIALLGEGIPALVNLHSLSLVSMNQELCKDDYLLYRLLKHNTTLTRLEITFAYMSELGILELANSLANCSKLELLRLIYYDMNTMLVFFVK